MMPVFIPRIQPTILYDGEPYAEKFLNFYPLILEKSLYVYPSSPKKAVFERIGLFFLKFCKNDL